jgi:hypothetical protein
LKTAGESSNRARIDDPVICVPYGEKPMSLGTCVRAWVHDRSGPPIEGMKAGPCFRCRLGEERHAAWGEGRPVWTVQEDRS